ncbi:tRNA pseudouridine(55) synthase TruB [Bacillus timonensis]|nr:tRNA pseudouridine(55) synthase TruB [Bacillus timonensis]
MEGILLLNKPKGLTSHDCVFKVRKLLKIKKIGHTGTLDPDVTGVLPLCIGRATKVVEYITGAEKTYEGEVTIGFSTSTEDASGDIIEKKIVNRDINRKEVLSILQSLTGEITQTPPMYSAVKVKGKRLYEYARQGIEIERPSRLVTIKEIVLLDNREIFDGETISFRFRVTCSKGTYIRTLAVTIGEKLGYPAHMSDLKRVASGNYHIDECYSFEEIEEMVLNNTLLNKLLPIESAISYLPNITINDTVAEKVKNGAVLPLPDTMIGIEYNQPFTVFDSEGTCLAIYKRHPEKLHLMKPEKILVNNQELT